MKHMWVYFILFFLLFGCTRSSEGYTNTESSTIVNYDSDDLNSDESDKSVQLIQFMNDDISFDGTGAHVTDTTITITQAGTYKVSGTLDDGSIIINASSDALVRIILDDANITCSTSSPLYIIQANKVVVTLAQNSENKITDGTSYIQNDITSNEPSATIFSKDDLTINGSGSLEVIANYNNGIQSKDDLKIISANIKVQSADDAFVGKDLLSIKEATIEIEASGDGLKTTNIEDSTKGNLAIEDATIVVTSQTDGIQAANGLYIYSGTINIISGGGSANSSKQSSMMNGNPWGNWNTSTDEDSTSAKGLKSQTLLEIYNGDLSLDTSDDAIHTNGTLQIKNGDILIHSGDDGIHADTSITILDGNIDIQQSYEGIESGELSIYGGTILIISDDDGLNAGGGNDASSTNGRPGQNEFASDASKIITIDGGYLYINAEGDGIDSNGNLTVNGGTILIDGPVDGANGALDFNGEFTITGGYLIASGSSSMLQTPTSIANGNCVTIHLNSTSSLLHIQDSLGEDIMTYEPTKNIQALVLYSTNIQLDSTYEIYLNGSSTGVITNGLYTGGDYTDGELYESFTVQSTNTTVGNTQNIQKDGIPSSNTLKNSENRPHNMPLK